MHALEIISGVTINNLRNLGTILGIESSRLDEIDSHPLARGKENAVDKDVV